MGEITLPPIDGRLYLLLPMLCGLLSLAGCSGSVTDAAGAKVAGAVYRAPIEPMPSSASYGDHWESIVAEAKPPYETALTFREAIARALKYGPGLQAASWEVEAKLGEAAQAAVRPNPELSMEVENFAGTGDLGGFNSAEGTLGLTQLV